MCITIGSIPSIRNLATFPTESGYGGQVTDLRWSGASGQKNWNWADNKPAATPPQPSPLTGMDATLQLSRYPAGSTSTAYSSGLQSDRQDGDSEVDIGIPL